MKGEKEGKEKDAYNVGNSIFDPHSYYFESYVHMRIPT